MSTPDPQPAKSPLPGLRLRRCATDVVEVAAQRGRAADLERIAAGRGATLPAFGRALLAADRAAICVRPARWLLLSSPAAPGSSAAAWADACAGRGVAVDLSSGLVALDLAGPAVREVLARGCRLDLDPSMFPPGRAAATIMAQVSVILVATRAGVLLLTPSTTARHFIEWLEHTAAPFGVEHAAARGLPVLCGDPHE